MPVDLVAVQADDALLDLLGNVDRTSGAVDHTLGAVDGELVRVLTSWRREVHADSIRELVDTDTALAAIGAARQSARPRRLVFAPVAAAAAVLVIAFSAVGLLAKSAHPGDGLWGVTQVLYSDYARSVEAAAFVQAELEQAKTALQQGRPEEAKASLELIQQQLPAIAEAEGRTDLTARHHELERELGGDPSGQVPPPGSPNASSSEQREAPLTPAPAQPYPAPEQYPGPGQYPAPETNPDQYPAPEQYPGPGQYPAPETNPDQYPAPETNPAPEPNPAPPPPVPNPPPPPEPNPPPEPEEPSTQPRVDPPTAPMPPDPGNFNPIEPGEPPGGGR
jgi:hypothetical protein